MRKLTTTAYAMLGLLSLRPISTYELTRRMRISNLRALWPRAESQVYEEPKKLAAEGLADAKVEFVGDRKRTVYRATPEGRAALREWLGRESDRFRYRYEALVKVAFANFGQLEDLRRTLGEVREEAREDARAMLAVAEARTPGVSPVPERAHLNALADVFILEIIEARLRWAERAEEIVADWSSTQADEATRAQAEEIWQDFEDRIRELLGEDEGAEETP